MTPDIAQIDAAIGHLKYEMSLHGEFTEKGTLLEQQYAILMYSLRALRLLVDVNKPYDVLELAAGFSHDIRGVSVTADVQRAFNMAIDKLLEKAGAE